MPTPELIHNQLNQTLQGPASYSHHPYSNVQKILEAFGCWIKEHAGGDLAGDWTWLRLDLGIYLVV